MVWLSSTHCSCTKRTKCSCNWTYLFRFHRKIHEYVLTILLFHYITYCIYFSHTFTNDNWLWPQDRLVVWVPGCTQVRLHVITGTHIYLYINREHSAPQINPAIFPAYKYLQSVHNTVIEAFWRWLLQKLGYNLKDHILRGQNEHFFNPVDPIHMWAFLQILKTLNWSCLTIIIQVFYWIFVPLVQAELDDFQEWWNCHHIRAQPKKEMPSGHVPYHLFSDPNSAGGEDLGIKVGPEVLHGLWNHLEEEEGSRSKHLAFVSAEFSEASSAVSEELNLPALTWENSWNHFAKIVVQLESSYSSKNSIL